ncbi:MAG: sulfatase-like hydrolase/transferase [Candidatus Thiodiazotropha sp.]
MRSLQGITSVFLRKTTRVLFFIFMLTGGTTALSGEGNLNFVSISIDDLNAFATLKSLYPGTLHTPNIDRLANQGVAFVNAFAPVALCNPSRASVLSGQYPATTGVHDNSTHWYDALDAAATLPAVLKSSGYYTSVIGKVFHTNIEAAPTTISSIIADEATWNIGGWNGNVTDNPFRVGPLAMPVEDHGDFINAEAAVDFISNYDGGDPFALFVGFYKPHMDWVVPQEYFDMYPVEDIEFPIHMTDDLDDIPDFMERIVTDFFHNEILSHDFWKQALQGYFASISFADAMLGKVLDALDANGHTADTVILLWSDHGYHLGDKENWHKFTLWDEAGRAPLIIATPNAVNTGARVEQVVELVDIYPTVLDILGITSSNSLAGSSLIPFMQNPQRQTNESAVTSMYGSVSLRTNEYRYTRYEDGSEELYDVRSDPHQHVNLAYDTTFATTKAALIEELHTHPAVNKSIFGTAGSIVGNTDETNIIVAGPYVSDVTGGSLDDTYFISDSTLPINEMPDGGIDTVFATSSFVLPDNIENLSLKTSYGQNHTLTGNDGANFIHGSNAIHGRAGNDILALRFRTPGIVDGGAGNDILHGSNGADTLVGGPGDDTVYAHSGDDIIIGGLGSDFLNGQNGIDIVDYSNIPGPVRINLAARQAHLSDGIIDQLTSIEGAVGTQSSDLFIGNAADNTFWIGGGDDLVAGGGGIDTVALPLLSNELILSGYVTDGSTTTLFYQVDEVDNSVRFTGIEGFIFEDGQHLSLAEMTALADGNMVGQGEQLLFDFDGDDSADLLFQHIATNAVMAIDGDGTGNQVDFNPVTGIDVIPTLDLNGDGSSDLLYRRPDGMIYTRNGAAGEIISGYGNRSGQTLIGIADFDNDGGNDLLFRRDNDNALFIIDGNGGFQTGLGINDVADVYVPGDLNGNGTADVLLRDRDGGIFSREGASGAVITGYGDRSGQVLLGATDFDGDGDLDLIFKRLTDESVFVIDGAGSGFQLGFGPRPNTEITLGGDLNGNGSFDLIIRDSSGNMQARDGVTGGKITSYGDRTGQDLLAIADFDGDNGQDLLFRSTEDDRVFVINGDGGFQLGLGTQIDVDIHVLGDLNGNGTADILYVRQDGTSFSRDGENLLTIANYGDRTGQQLINTAYDQYRALVPEGVWTPPISADMFSW